MKFFYENSLGDNGIFAEENIVKAIYTAWNIEANLYLIENNKENLIFAPWESNEVNSELLKRFGYYMEDGEEYREIKDIKTKEVVKYDWSEVKKLI